jgi:Tfp pilus assembly protein PilO
VTQRDRIMLGVVLAVAVLAGAFMFAIKPKREEASQLAEQAQAAQTRRDAALASLANAKQARADFGEAQIAIARMGKAVPADDDVATVVFQLERSARQAGIDFRAVRLEAGGADPTPDAGAGTDTPQGANMTKVPFKLTFEGEFFDLRRFLDHARSFTRMKNGKHVSVRGRLLDIEGVSLAAGPGGFPEIKAQVNVSAYTAPAPSSAGATTSGDTATSSSGSATDTSASATTAAATGVTR